VVRRGTVQYALKKAVLVAKHLRKEYVATAVGKLESEPRKIGSYFQKSLFNAIDHARHKGLDVKRLRIHRVLVGRKVLHKKIRYHAKSKVGKAHHPEVKYRIELVEEPLEEFYGKAARGQFPVGLAANLRHILAEAKAPF
jgi:ribosomal protein L22